MIDEQGQENFVKAENWNAIKEKAAGQGKDIVTAWKKKSRRRRTYRLLLMATLMLILTTFIGLSIYGIMRRIPSVIYFRARQSQSMDLKLPATGEVRAASVGQGSYATGEAVTIDLSYPVTMRTAGQERYDMQVRLFGILPLKRVDIRVIEDRELVPMGMPVGIYLKSAGIMVIDVAEFLSDDGKMVSPAKSLLEQGDIILELNGKTLEDKEDLINGIENCQGCAITLLIKRDGRDTKVSLMPRRNQNGQYKAGIWVRDDAQGVGTLTYVDGEGKFGALGHGIADVDTGRIVEVREGALYQTEIVRLRRGEHGSPGEMTGRIAYDDQFVLGEVNENSDRGIYGKFNSNGLSFATEDPLPIGLKQEIEFGPAQILCTLEDEVECFEAEITKVHLEGAYVNRGIELRVTDEGLLRRTGGIVQGMSGSPILQNGKIIGAVTHVLVNSPEKGYGIFIENMLESGSGQGN